MTIGTKQLFEPLISIIVPVYNTELLLSKCVDSILTQSYGNFELFLIDDGSTDFSGKICDEYALKDKRVIVIHKENEGQGVARNLALDKAKGEYILFVDSDDYISTDTLQLLINTVKKQNCDMVIFGIQYDYGKIKKTRLRYDDGATFNAKELIYEYFVTGLVSCFIWDKFYSARLWENVRFPSLRADEDSYVLPEVLSKAEKAVYVREPLYTQLVRNGSTEQKRFNEHKLSNIKSAQHTADYVRLNYPELKIYVELNYAIALETTLCKIVNDFALFKYRDLYKKLLCDLDSELCRIDTTEFEDVHKVYDKLMFCAKKQSCFILKQSILGIIICLKRFVKAILQKL